MRPRGVLALLVGTSDDDTRRIAESRGVRLSRVNFAPDPAALTKIAGLAHSRHLMPYEHGVLPLVDAGRAHADARRAEGSRQPSAHPETFGDATRRTANEFVT